MYFACSCERISASEMANVFDVYDQRPKSKSKATEYFTWSLKKIQKENWDANVSFYWHKNAVEYCKKRHKDIFGAEEEKDKNDATTGESLFLYLTRLHIFR